MRKATTAALICAGLVGCARFSDNSHVPLIQSAWPQYTWSRAGETERPEAVPIFYVTDRNVDKGDGQLVPPREGGYGANWSSARCGRLIINLVPNGDAAYASIVPGTAVGQLCEPGTPEQEMRNEELAKRTETALASFAGAIGSAAAKATCVLIYVQGFNNTFDRAAITTAQIYHDVNISVPAEQRCIPIAYSWSSAGQIDRYVSDVEHSSYSVPLLRVPACAGSPKAARQSHCAQHGGAADDANAGDNGPSVRCAHSRRIDPCCA